MSFIVLTSDNSQRKKSWVWETIQSSMRPNFWLNIICVCENLYSIEALLPVVCYSFQRVRNEDCLTYGLNVPLEVFSVCVGACVCHCKSQKKKKITATHFKCLIWSSGCQSRTQAGPLWDPCSARHPALVSSSLLMMRLVALCPRGQHTRWVLIWLQTSFTCHLTHAEQRPRW